jgi:predicted NBD/HSP70 family sugar kinase
LPGQVGHLLVDPSGPVCELGHRGCASAYVTNSAIVQALGGETALGEGYQHALQRARRGDKAAVRVFDDAAFAAGTIIGTVVNLIDPQKVILTGDGLPLWEIASESVLRGIHTTVGVRATSVDLDVQRFDFGEWARAGAAVAIRMITSD